MRKSIAVFALLAALLAVCPTAAFASGSGDEQPSRVNITVIMPEAATAEDEPEEKEEEEDSGQDIKETPAETEAKPTPAPVPTPVLYPVSVDEVNDKGVRSIVKVYELGPGENPAHISREPFERGGLRYELSDVIKAETAFANSKEHTETVTLNTGTKDTAAILGKLEPTIAYESEDGYAGVLALNVASVKVEQAGTKTDSFTVTETREYPQLSSPDTSLVPKTISDGGKTYSLAKVDWRSGNNEAVDYEAMPEYYTAVASYTATGSKTVVTGYVTTAEYTGSIGRISEGKTVYTAYFIGAEIKPEITPIDIMSCLPEQVTGAQTGSPDTETDAATSGPAAAEPPGPDASITEDGEVKGPEKAGSTAPLVVSVAIAALLTGGGAGYFITLKLKSKKIGGDAHEKTD